MTKGLAIVLACVLVGFIVAMVIGVDALMCEPPCV
jgi:hypothetical protein